MNPQPSMRPSVYTGANPDGWFCVVPNCSRGADPTARITSELHLMANLGVSVVRVEFPWPLLEPQQGHFVWDRADLIVRTADRYGLQLQPVLVYTPSWAGPSMLRAPTDTASWTTFVHQVVARYQTSVHYWELWNEPDGGGYWQDGTQQYVQSILIPGSHAVKAVDPAAHILLGAPYYADTAFLNAVYANGGGTSFDIIGFHEYANALGLDAVQHDVDTVQGVLTSHGQPTKPIWIGEYGYNELSATTADSSHIAAMTIMLRHVTGYQVALWYNLRDDDAMTCCPPHTVKAAYWGLVQHDGRTLKQGYATMRSLLRALSPH